MNKLVMSAALLTLIGGSANAAIVTLGAGLARSCYEASQAQDNSPEAIRTCDRALEEQALDRHDLVATHVNRGILHYLSNDLASANRDYDAALAINPNEAEAWLNKAFAALKGGNDEVAMPLFVKAIDLRTVRPALAYYGRGVALENRGRLREAYADLLRARDLDPKWSVPGEELKRYQLLTH